jgi:ABC-type amino acid transport substrate-binding protein
MPISVSRPVTRRFVLTGALGAAGVALLAACGGGAASPTANPPKPNAPTTVNSSGATASGSPAANNATSVVQQPGSAPAGATPATSGSPAPATGGTAGTQVPATAATKPAAATAQTGAATAAATVTPQGVATGAAGASPAAGATGAAAAKPASTPVPLPKPGDMPAGSYMKTIFDRGKLIAGVKTDTPLFGYLNPRTNKIEGFDVEICKEIAKAIFGDPEKVELKEVTSASRIPLLQQGAIDLFAATATINKERLQQIDFSDVYYEAGQKLLVPKNSTINDIKDTSGKKICAAKGSTSETNITKFQPQAQVVQADKYTECLLAMQQGRADGISTDDAILAGLAATDPNTKVVGDRFTQEPYGVGVAKGKEGFLPFVNAVLADLKKSGRWAAIYKEWPGKYLPDAQPPTRTAQEAAGA